MGTVLGRSRVVSRDQSVESISAVTLATADMRASVTFYEALGFSLLYGGTDAAFTSFRAGAGFVNLQAEASRAVDSPIWGRVIFWVDDVDDAYARAVEHGYEPEFEPRDAPWGERYFHLRDPSGHELSFARRHDAV
jgi:catechol 2,3-dioxygenase-like lactoylglutathione lyase family enzyme